MFTRQSRSILLLTAITLLAMTACGPAAPTEEIYVVVTSTTLLPPSATPTSLPVLASVTPAIIATPPPELGLVPDATQPAGEPCAGAPAARLFVGGTGRVTITNGIPVNVRADAGIGAEKVGAMDEATQFSVVGGPVCSDSMWWWNIDASTGVGGWAAEGDLSGYFLEPYP